MKTRAGASKLPRPNMTVIERTIQVSFSHRVYFTRNVFGGANPLLNEVLTGGENGLPRKALLVLDESLHVAQPQLRRQIETYFDTFAQGLKLVCPPLVLEGGERVKNSYFHVSEIQSQL